MFTEKKFIPSFEKISFWLGGLAVGAFALYLELTRPELFTTIVIAALILLTIQKKLHFGLYIILFLPILGELSRISILGQERGFIASDLILPVFIVIWFLTKKNSLALTEKSKKIVITTGIFIAIASLSLLLSSLSLPFKEVALSSLYLIRYIEYALLFPITLNLLSFTKEEGIDEENPLTPEKLIQILAFSSLLIAFGGFIQLIIYPNLEKLTELGYDPHINRLVGSWLDPNFIGGFFAFMICIFSGIFLQSKNTRSKIFYIFLISILLIALFLTYSRSAYLALSVGIFVIGSLRSRKALIIVSILAIMGVSVSERAQQRLGELVTSMKSVVFNSTENPDPTARLRIQSWEETLNLINKKPLLGHGYNTLKYAKIAEGYVKDEELHSASGSDSSFLTIIATTGIIGFIPFCFIYFLSLKHSLERYFKKSKNRLIQGFSLGFFAGTLSLLTHSLFVNSLVFPQILIFFWVSLALVHTSIQRKNQSTS